MSRLVRSVEGLLPFLKSYSIRKKIKSSYIIIIGLMLLPSVISLSTMIFLTYRYDRIISNVSQTNQLNQIVKTEITDEIWNIFAGKEKFSGGKQYEIIKGINQRLDKIKQNTHVSENQKMLEVAQRAVKTLTHYVDRLGYQITQNYSVAENETMLDEIRGVSTLISDLLQDFIVLEIESAASTNERIKQSARTLIGLQILINMLVVFFAVFAQRSVTLSINMPIKELERMSRKIAEGDLQVRVESPGVKELNLLTENLNIMAGRIHDLIETNIQEQKNLQKSEMKALQAQITPHFLYNTLDTIIWLTEVEEYRQVIDVTRAFSSFFRTSLSKGRDWIDVEEEINHVRSYLTIQKIRYRDILDYSIEIAPAMAKKKMVKLLLQPLVENALYHGIKNKRSQGNLRVRGTVDAGRLCFIVEDNGIGMKKEKLEEIIRQMRNTDKNEHPETIYGLYNVYRRLELYYDGNADLSIESEYGKGTTVSFSLPMEKCDV